MINIVTDDDTGASTTLIEVDKDDFEHGNERERREGKEGREGLRRERMRENEKTSISEGEHNYAIFNPFIIIYLH